MQRQAKGSRSSRYLGAVAFVLVSFCVLRACGVTTKTVADLAMILLSSHTADLQVSEPQTVSVIGAGFGRTGSDSLRVALNHLGYKTYHMREVFDGGHLKYWDEFARATPEGLGTDHDIDKLMDRISKAGYNATTDFPACLLYRHFLRRNPNGKVILSVRTSPEVWATSYTSTIGRFSWIGVRPPMSLLMGSQEFFAWVHRNARLSPGPDDVVSFATAVSAYKQWIDDVVAAVPPNQLLIHKAQDGWGPICEFLQLSGPACPSIPYPHVNDGASLAVTVTILEAITIAWPYAIVALPCALTFFCVRCARRQGKSKRA